MSLRNTAALFPGQGSQYPGMVKELLENFPFVRIHYEEASDTLKENLLKLCSDGPADQLQLTFNAQPAILVTSYSWFQVLQRSFDFTPTIGAGHSLGEYSALVSSGALTLAEGVRLVRKRGELMQSTVPVGKGKMAALIGLEDAQVEELCKKASDRDTSVVPANFNAPGQVVVAGHAQAVDRLVAISSSGEFPELKARKVIPLSVSAPFHCPLMKPVAEAFVAPLSSINWKANRFPIVANLDAQTRSYTKGEEIVPVLRDQIDHPVRWTQCVKTIAPSVERYIELGPGKVLAGLVKRIVDGAKLVSLDSLNDFKTIEKWMQEA